MKIQTLRVHQGNNIWLCTIVWYCPFNIYIWFMKAQVLKRFSPFFQASIWAIPMWRPTCTSSNSSWRLPQLFHTSSSALPSPHWPALLWRHLRRPFLSTRRWPPPACRRSQCPLYPSRTPPAALQLCLSSEPPAVMLLQSYHFLPFCCLLLNMLKYQFGIL
jgi:hypothetical protein